jgi:hypothetical protein
MGFYPKGQSRRTTPLMRNVIPLEDESLSVRSIHIQVTEGE